jgi:uncharacterized membrane-anchored protein
MKKNLSLIYQFLNSRGIRNTYQNTILISIGFVFIHIVIIQDILHVAFNVNKFLGPDLLLIITIVFVGIILLFYRKRNLLSVKFSKEELKSQLIKRCIYLFAVLLLLFILEEI